MAQHEIRVSTRPFDFDLNNGRDAKSVPVLDDAGEPVIGDDGQPLMTTAYPIYLTTSKTDTGVLVYRNVPPRIFAQWAAETDAAKRREILSRLAASVNRGSDTQAVVRTKISAETLSAWRDRYAALAASIPADQRPDLPNTDRDGNVIPEGVKGHGTHKPDDARLARMLSDADRTDGFFAVVTPDAERKSRGGNVRRTDTDKVLDSLFN